MRIVAFGLPLSIIGCSTLLSIDADYIVVTPDGSLSASSGGTSSSGMSSSGMSSSGMSSSGGATDASRDTGSSGSGSDANDSSTLRGFCESAGSVDICIDFDRAGEDLGTSSSANAMFSLNTTTFVSGPNSGKISVTPSQDQYFFRERSLPLPTTVVNVFDLQLAFRVPTMPQGKVVDVALVEFTGAGGAMTSFALAVDQENNGVRHMDAYIQNKASSAAASTTQFVTFTTPFPVDTFVTAKLHVDFTAGSIRAEALGETKNAALTAASARNGLSLSYGAKVDRSGGSAPAMDFYVDNVLYDAN
jgi:hypothetical protein